MTLVSVSCLPVMVCAKDSTASSAVAHRKVDNAFRLYCLSCHASAQKTPAFQELLTLRKEDKLAFTQRFFQIVQSGLMPISPWHRNQLMSYLEGIQPSPAGEDND